jgi:hypothetical protein
MGLMKKVFVFYKTQKYTVLPKYHINILFFYKYVPDYFILR